MQFEYFYHWMTLTFFPNLQMSQTFEPRKMAFQVQCVDADDGSSIKESKNTDDCSLPVCTCWFYRLDDLIGPAS